MNTFRRILPRALVVLAMTAGCGQPLLRTDFEQDPRAAGWQCEAVGTRGMDCKWVGSLLEPGGGHLLATDGRWVSPLIPVRPLEYYRLRFRCSAPRGGYWAAVFYGEDGAAMASDDYSAAFASKDWTTGEFCFEAELESVGVRIRFESGKDGPMRVDDVSVRPVSRAAAARWAERLYAELPPLPYEPPSPRWTHIPLTMEKLRAGETLTVVMLGDSIVNDTANSCWDAVLERAWPGARVRLISSVRGGTGCTYYQRQGRVEQYVARHHPDLVIIGGISHNYQAEPIRRVVRQVREQTDAEVLVMSGAVPSVDARLEHMIRFGRVPPAAARKRFDDFQEQLAKMVREEKVEFLDMFAAWESYIESADKPREWFMRDRIHANSRGKQILGRILVAYLTPDVPRPPGEAP